MDSNTKPQQTGGLKLMTVFIAVLALHVVIIGSFTVYHLMSGGSSDADLTTLDKNHKKSADGTVITDSSLADATLGEKNASTTAAATDAATTSITPADVTTIPTTPTTTTPNQTTVTEVASPALSIPAPTPAPTPAPATVASTPTPAPAPAPAETAPAPDVVDNAVSPAPAPLAPSAQLAPPPEPTLTLAAPQAPVSPLLTPANPTATLSAGPVHMPPTMDSNQAREHGQVYVVKITDSYKKIAHAHNISVAQLKAANHIKGDTLHTGQKLVIPSAGTLAAAPATTTTSTHLDATPVQPMLANSVSSTITPSASHHHTYTVVKGDTLVRIAHKFKTTPAALMEANDITDPTKLAIGKKLKIPSQESRSARINTPPQMEKPTTIMPTAVQPPVAQPTAVQPMEPQPSQVESAPQQTQDDASGHLANFVP